MPVSTDRAPRGRHTDRHQVASLAHATAHEVAALREAMRRLREGSDPMTLLASMVVERTERIALMAGQVVGHA